VVGRHRVVFEHRGPEDVEGEAGVVGTGVPVEEGVDQPVGPQGGKVGQGRITGDPLVPTPDADPPGDVVEPQGGPIGAGHAPVDHATLAEQGDEEREWRHQVGGVLQQALAFRQILVDQPELVLLEVAESAVHQLRRLRRGPGGKVVLLHQGGPQPSAGGVEGHPGAGDATANHQQIEVIGGQAGEGVWALERRPRCLVGLAIRVRMRHLRSLPQADRCGDPTGGPPTGHY